MTSVTDANFIEDGSEGSATPSPLSGGGAPKNLKDATVGGTGAGEAQRSSDGAESDDEEGDFSATSIADLQRDEELEKAVDREAPQLRGTKRRPPGGKTTPLHKKDSPNGSGAIEARHSLPQRQSSFAAAFSDRPNASVLGTQEPGLGGDEGSEADPEAAAAMQERENVKTIIRTYYEEKEPAKVKKLKQFLDSTSQSTAALRDMFCEKFPAEAHRFEVCGVYSLVLKCFCLGWGTASSAVLVVDMCALRLAFTPGEAHNCKPGRGRFCRNCRRPDE